ncbi:ferritin-like domain-containing protein [Aquimarina intermedia]|uniref:Uncharacterized protein (TIGR02284 family) n=1 Tax=Aquimarina intermedia TaxID=350814 RepID=A0A5S5CFU9_9FLAO|nr:PA2169 family four-helix-bundle protein [Aquimarina intermedia]TYP77230.1 uncharacterized protein (TIGR02284 family) [Aquimarina intermedia]
MKYSEKVAKQLNELLEKNYDAEKGYKTAAENVKNNDLKAYFNKRAQERYNFGHEIKNEIKSFGESPDKGTSVKGDLHRTWMNIKSALSANSEESILEETIRGEKAAAEEYTEVLKETSLPLSTTTILKKHRDNISEALNDVKRFESSFS